MNGVMKLINFLSLKDHVYNYIVEQINNGTLVAGKKVNEKDICEDLEVSRTPVREALIQLSSEGFLENVPRKGFIIKRLTTEDAQETYCIIGALDGLAASLAIPYLTDKHIQEMDFYVQSIDLAIQTGNFQMYDKMQAAFHSVYLSMCPNKSLVNLLLQLQKRFMKTFDHLGDTDDTKAKLIQTNNEHRKMIELFKNKEANELERYLKEVHWNTEKANFLPL